MMSNLKYIHEIFFREINRNLKILVIIYHLPFHKDIDNNILLTLN